MKCEPLDANARDLFVAAMSWMEEYWDQTAGLLWDAGESKLDSPHHAIRGSVWYVFGLLMRNLPRSTGALMPTRSDGRASENRLELTTTGEIAFLVHAPGTHIEQIKYDTCT